MMSGSIVTPSAKTQASRRIEGVRADGRGVEAELDQSRRRLAGK